MNAPGTAHNADGFVDCSCGHRHWGLAGAAGLLLWRVQRGRVEVLLQERAEWAHEGGSWSIPGGARKWDEPAITTALREAHEEAGIAADTVALSFTHRQQHPDWSYVTVVGRALDGFTCTADGHESRSLRWVAWNQLDYYPLHPALDAIRDELAPLLHLPVVLIDSANVVGSRADGWWNDRVGAAGRLHEQLRELSATGWPGKVFDSSADKIYPIVVQVLEGQAKALEVKDTYGAAAPGITDGQVVIHRADGSGDDALVELAEAINAGLAGAYSESMLISVITSDHGLQERLREVGAAIYPSSTVDRALGNTGHYPSTAKRRGRGRARRRS